MTIRRRALGRGWFRAALLAVAVLPTGAHAVRTQEDNPRLTLGETLNQAQAALNANNCAGALSQVDPVLARDDFGTLPDQAKIPFLTIAAICELRDGDNDAALAHSLAASELPGAPALVWRFRFGLQAQTGDHEAAVTTLEQMQALDLDSWSEIDPDWIFTLNRQFRREQKYSPLHVRLLALVSRPGFPPARTKVGFDWLRLSYARYLARNADTERARTVIGNLRLAYALRDASLDPDVRALLPDDFDLRAATEKQLAMFKTMEKERPSLLANTLEVAGTLRSLGQPAKAVEVLEAARPYGALEKMFTDRDDRINWWWDELARAYEQLGRYEDAAAAYRQAIAEGESGDPGHNVSQVINLGYLQHRFGHDKEALETLTRMESATNKYASPYGRMEFHLAHGCAAWSLGRKAAAEKDLVYAREHKDDHPQALRNLYGCMDDMDSAAAEVIRQLEDPDKRIDALSWLSQYDDPDAGVPPDPFRSQAKALRERADVKAAIDKAGGIRRFHVVASGL